ncbi:MAG: carbon-nitrogen hydrolase family protein [Candidatus Izemoplasmataceae bacterium]
MNVLLCSSKFVNNDIKHNSNKMIELLQKKSYQKIEFLFFGESFLNGFDALTWNRYEDLKIKEETNKYIDILSKKCKEYNRGLGFGYFEFDDEKIYSSYIVFDSNGNKLVNYRRITNGWRFPNVDTSIYCEGLSIGMFEYKGYKFGIGLCGDVWIEALYNQFLNYNFDVFVWPVFVNYDPTIWKENERVDYMMRSKSLGTHVLYINSISNGPSYGGTYFQANGELIGETEPSEDEFCYLAQLNDID